MHLFHHKCKVYLIKYQSSFFISKCFFSDYFPLLLFLIILISLVKICSRSLSAPGDTVKWYGRICELGKNLLASTFGTSLSLTLDILERIAIVDFYMTTTEVIFLITRVLINSVNTIVKIDSVIIFGWFHRDIWWLLF